MTTSLSYAPDEGEGDDNRIDDTKTLISALSFLSRNLPLPPDVFDAVNSIYANGDDVHAPGSDDDSVDDNGLFTDGGDLLADLEDALAKQRNHMTGAEMAEARKKRIESHIQSRVTQLEDLPTSRGEDLQTKCLIELYGLKLAELQRKVRSDVSSEYMLCLNCANPEKQLFDWGKMRLPRYPYGVGDAFAVDSDNPLKKKRDAEVIF
ncbi:Helicase, C-terminal [Artemisia annua]|uniref:Helicase, C-terminal n=1 Tax=Artemisia annua TaxID=35608 RepID=A0A2U1NPJ2_ARTAN|nr:Helicase, C-terminal [Artemisia annua]